ncbi:MAG TPA: pectate lyase [Cyclobacteriaceae bacterium]|nr:pectate lyase [Cyclobacteriaceae bacterium]
MKKLLFILFLFAVASISGPSAHAQGQGMQAEARETMLKATKFMVENVSNNGGYVSQYLPDLSRRWGELEAFESMVWIEGTGTVRMGELLLEAYQATGDEYYYEAAKKAARALAWGQHETGGWHYFIDFAGEGSVKKWYETIGKNAWGFEEHNHYYGNATFDGGNTAKAAQFLLRLYLEKLEPEIKVTLDKAIGFILESQYPLGGWPQRYPLKYDFPHGNLEDYTSFYTFNDNVISENINFLIQCYLTLGGRDFLDPIRRAMNFYIISQHATPQAGWSKQHNMALQPAHARTYEPAAIYPDFTYENAKLLLRFYELTGDRKFLARVPDAISFLESVAQKNPEGKTVYPIFVEIGTNKPLYAHREGTNVRNGRYWLDYNPENQIQHYKGRNFDLNFLRKEYERLNSLSPAEASKNSPLKDAKLIRNGADLKADYLKRFGESETRVTEEAVKKIFASLDDQGRWLIKHPTYSLPYSIDENGMPSNTARRSDELGVSIPDPSEQEYISTGTYIRNMEQLIQFISAKP